MSAKRFLWVLPVLLLMSTAVTGDGREQHEGDGQNQYDKEHRHHLPITTPEPASLLLLGTGMVTLAAKMRKKKTE